MLSAGALKLDVVCKSRWLLVCRALLLATLALSSVGQMHADVVRRGEEAEKKNKKPIQVPEVRAVSAKFVAGGNVEVELIGVVSSLRQLEFVIREGPQNGTLSEIRPHPRETNRAFVLYTHNKDAPATDGFTYACRLDGGPFSAPGRVTLAGQRFDPILKVTKQPMFNRIFAGGMMESSVTVENVGAAPFQGPMAWKPPFYGPEEVTIPPGEKMEFAVSFRPDRAGHYRWELPLPGNDPHGVIEFYGDSIPALTVSPGRLVLKWDAATRERFAILTLGNGRPDVMDVKLKLPTRLGGLGEVAMKPQGREDVRLWLKSSDVEAFSEEIEVQGSGVTERVLVTADAQPPDLRLVLPSDKVLDFGTLRQRAQGEQQFTISNSGGQDLLTTLTVRPPFAIQESGQTIRLQPGQERRFAVKVDTRAAGNFISTVEVAGAAQTISLSLRAVVKEGEGGATSSMPSTVAEHRPQEVQPTDVETSAAQEQAVYGSGGKTEVGKEVISSAGITLKNDRKVQGLIAAALATNGVSVNHPGLNLYLDQVKELKVSQLTQTGLLLSWPETKIKPTAWRVEAAANGIKPENGTLVKFWQPITNWKTAENAPSDSIAVSIDALKPGAQYEFRVMGVDQEGKLARPSPSVLITTLPVWRVPAWVWRTLIVAALGTIFYLLYRVRRGDFELEH